MIRVSRRNNIAVVECPSKEVGFECLKFESRDESSIFVQIPLLYVGICEDGVERICARLLTLAHDNIRRFHTPATIFLETFLSDVKRGSQLRQEFFRTTLARILC
jgi:hypothetical protein